MKVFLPGINYNITTTDEMKVLSQEMNDNGLVVVTELNVLFAFKVALMKAHINRLESIEFIENNMSWYDKIEVLDR